MGGDHRSPTSAAHAEGSSGSAERKRDLFQNGPTTTNIPPVATHVVPGSRGQDGVVLLESRVIGLKNGLRDLAVLEVDAVERCFCKARDERVVQAGVQYDWHGPSYYGDVVQPARGTQLPLFGISAK